jgi:Recombination directionality factor-like
MAVLDIQRRGQQIGRIRIGQQVKAANGKMRPARLDTFRFTTASRASAEAIAALFGGEIRDWSGEFEVISTKSEIGVTVPPRDEVISQWYEMWNKGGAMRRCDSQRDQISNGPCQCPHAADPSDAEDVAAKALERSELAKLNPPRACKLVTRISVMIPDLPGLGVFRLDTGSYYAATEIGDSAALMQVARDRGVFLPAILRIEQRQRVAGGQTKKYPVPVLEVLTTFRDLATGAIERAGVAAQLPPAPGETRRAITAAPPRAIPVAEQHAEIVDAEIVDEHGEQESEPLSAQQIWDVAAMASTPHDIEVLIGQAQKNRVQQDLVHTSRDSDDCDDLMPALMKRRRELAGAA